MIIKIDRFSPNVYYFFCISLEIHTMILFTLSFKMHFGPSDHKWTVLNISVNNHQDTL